MVKRPLGEFDPSSFSFTSKTLDGADPGKSNKSLMLTVYKEWYQVVTQLYLFSYMMEVASNYMFWPLWWPSSGCT